MDATSRSVALFFAVRETLGVLLPFLFRIGVELLLPLGHPIEGRLSDVDVTFLDEVSHLAEEEGEEERADVGSIHIRVGHDDDLVVTGLLHIEVLPDPRADRGDHGADLFVRENFVDPCALDVENLALEGQDGLERAIPALLRTAAGTVALDEVDLAEAGVRDGAVRQLARQYSTLQRALLPGEVSRLPGRLPGPGRRQRLLDDGLGGLGVFVEEDGEVLVDGRLDGSADLAVTQLGLRLPLELGLHDLHAEDAGQPFPNVIAGEALVYLLEQIAAPGVVVDGPGERRLEPGQVGPTFMGVDVVDEGVRVLAEAVVVLHRHLDVRLLAARLEVEHLFVKGMSGAPHIRHEGGQPTLVLMPLLRTVAFVGEHDREALVQVRHLTKTVVQGLEVVVELGEDLRVRLEGDVRAASLRLTDVLELLLLDPPGITLVVLVAVTEDFDLEPLGQRVHDAHSNPVQAPGHLVAVLVELAAGVERRHGELHPGHPFLGVDIHRNATPVVGHLDRAVLPERDAYLRAEARHGLVDGVVHHLVDEVV